MRKLLSIALLSFSLLLAAHGQQLVPELASASTIHRSNSTLLQDQRAVALEAASKPYLVALAAADQAATAAGKVAAVRAIGKEREALAKGEMGETMPPELPKNLVAARKAYLRGADKAESDFVQRQKALDTTYLRTLAALQERGAQSPTLAEQIKTEKERILKGIYGPLTDLRIGLEGTKWKDVKGDGIHQFRDGKLDGIWKFEPREADKVVLHWNATSKGVLTLSKDGKKLSDAERTWELITPPSRK